MLESDFLRDFLSPMVLEAPPINKKLSRLARLWRVLLLWGRVAENEVETCEMEVAED